MKRNITTLNTNTIKSKSLITNSMKLQFLSLSNSHRNLLILIPLISINAYHPKIIIKMTTTKTKSFATIKTNRQAIIKIKQQFKRLKRQPIGLKQFTSEVKSIFGNQYQEHNDYIILICILNILESWRGIVES